MPLKFDISHFPSTVDTVRARWTPIILAPILGSPERLVIGCAVANESGFHVEMLNAPDRLNCFYGSQAESLHLACKVAEDIVKSRISAGGIDSLVYCSDIMPSLSIGEINTAGARSLEEIARNWLSAISSVYYTQQIDFNEVAAGNVNPEQRRKHSDRLPKLVLDYISQSRFELSKFFREDIRSDRKRRRRNSAQEVAIDYVGRRIAANFSTLVASRLSQSAGVVKQRLWDLKVDRDRAEASDHYREHELILQIPRDDDPQVSDRQMSGIRSIYSQLESQADDVQLRLRAFNSVEQIGKHLIEAEAA